MHGTGRMQVDAVSIFSAYFPLLAQCLLGSSAWKLAVLGRNLYHLCQEPDSILVQPFCGSQILQQTAYSGKVGEAAIELHERPVPVNTTIQVPSSADLFSLLYARVGLAKRHGA